jgi:3'-phosphoadenosine 5'-phosphosulfate sulfotransferase (PAPS reductase)/FAD synthetase
MKFSAKMRYAERLIEAAFLLSERPIVAWSGGKDSTVLLHLIRQFKPEIDVIFNDTKVEFPETLKFVKDLSCEWNLNLHTARAPQGVNFWWCVERFGWPLLGKDNARDIQAIKAGGRTAFRRKGSLVWKAAQSGVPISDRCCYYLKEKPSEELYRNLGVDLVFFGIKAKDSHRRALNWLSYGDFFYDEKRKRWKIHPLSIWQDEDVWEYHRRFSLPLNPLYEMGYKGTGCWPCTMGVRFGALGELRRGHPGLFRYLIVNRGLGEELIKLKLALDDGQLSLFIHTWGDVEALLKERPCFFDRI